MDVLDPIKDLFGGGTLTPILIVAGVLALFVAYKLAKLTLRLIALGVAIALFAGTAPWASADLNSAAATCALRAVEDAVGGWQAVATKRVTIEDVSQDATCAGPEALGSGTATAKLRTFYDVPIQTWTVDPSGARPERLG